jgi:hypothetical protein
MTRPFKTVTAAGGVVLLVVVAAFILIGKGKANLHFPIQS